MKYLILKEFLKFKFAFLAFLLAIVFCLAWIFFDVKGGFDKFGAANYTLQIMFNKKFTYNHLDLLNIIFAVVIGISSMFFERINARIRVQFHYPHSYLRNALTLTLTPLCFLLFAFVLEICAMFFIFKAYFQIEVVTALLSTLLYSCAFSVGVFWLVQAATIEPDLRKVTANSLALVAMSYIYFKFNPDVGRSNLYYLNENLWVYIAICWVFCLCSLALALNNYKKGYIK